MSKHTVPPEIRDYFAAFGAKRVAQLKAKYLAEVQAAFPDAPADQQQIIADWSYRQWQKYISKAGVKRRAEILAEARADKAAETVPAAEEATVAPTDTEGR